jgi:hypothetical protein
MADTPDTLFRFSLNTSAQTCTPRKSNFPSGTLQIRVFSAESIDYRVGIGRPEGYGISSSQHGAASMAAMVLAVRTLQVASNPTANCFYTMKFVKALNKYWPKLGGFDRGAEEICYRSCDFR